MRWLIHGGCGFVGSNLADHLLTGGHEVTVLDNLSRTGSSANLAWLRDRHGEFRFVEADVRDAAGLRSLIAELRPEVVAHLAGQVAATTSLANPRLDLEINILGTFNALEAVRLEAPEAIFLFSSTNKVYGSLEELATVEQETRYVLTGFPDGLNEALPLDGSTPYGCSKLAAEQYVRDYHRMYGLRTVVFRHSSMYGGRQFSTFDQGWVGWFCAQAVRQAAEPDAEPFTISGDGKQVRDLLHAEDLIGCYTHAVAHIGAAAGRIYNIGGGMAASLSLLELFAALGARTGVPLRYVRTPWRIADQKVFVADGRRAAAEIGWQPRLSRDEGLDRALAWAHELRAAG